MAGRDAYGHRRSARNTYSGGPGSRGGGPSLSPKYWRDWRAAHPEYRERERTRCIRRRLLGRIAAIYGTGPAGYSVPVGTGLGRSQ